MIKRALLSVSNKEKIIELAEFLIAKGVEIISSGGTRKALEEHGFKVTDITSITGNPEAFGGRMKTLSFQVSSALLYRRDNTEDIAQAKELDINPIDLVVCNLYPFHEVAKRNGSIDELIENIDIGGPTMIRAAAKNFESVSVLTSPLQYESFMNSWKDGGVDRDFRRLSSLQALRHTALYDGMIVEVLEKKYNVDEKTISLSTEGAKELRYGENPDQKAWVINNHSQFEKTLANCIPLQGKALSYNNFLDADAAWRCNSDLNNLCSNKRNACVTIIKHANPCGAAIASSALEALEEAWSGDPISSFGSIIAFNREFNKDCANFLNNKFTEVIIAPCFSNEALNLLKSKKNLRLIELESAISFEKDYMLKTIGGGYVIQNEDSDFSTTLNTVTTTMMTDSDKEVIQFGMRVCKHLKSNAIALVRRSNNGDFKLIGAGMGNPNRLISLKQSVDKAHENGEDNMSEVILISDAFFPFKDNIELAHEYQISKIVQPGGSIKDQEVIDCCDELGISMIFTGRRHFRH